MKKDAFIRIVPVVSVCTDIYLLFSTISKSIIRWRDDVQNVFSLSFLPSFRNFLREMEMVSHLKIDLTGG